MNEDQLRAAMLAKAGQDIAGANAEINAMLGAIRGVFGSVDLESRVATIVTFLMDFEFERNTFSLLLAVALDRLAVAEDQP